MKLAFIVQRYGREILGGSETLARQLAERLSRRNEITVLTTTAKDYITWKNEYSPGEEKIRGVRVRRFPVTQERDLDEFNQFSQEVYGGKATREQELEWLERQGPIVPELIDYLKKEQDQFDLLVFFTYLYYPTYYGLAVAPEKSILVPTAHDEPPLKLGIFREMFQLPSSYIFNTEAEELLVLERFPVHKKMRETIGMGMELLDQPDPSTFRKKHDIPGNYLLYAGRIDGGKNLEELFRYFTFYKEEYPASGNLQLILIGKLGMKLPEDASIRYIGFVDEGDKLSAMAGALAVVQPSRMESLSIVTLEAFSVGSPVLANADSRVLVDHCRRSNAGFYYRDFEEFEEILNLLFSDRGLGRNLGRNGQRYIKDNFGWAKLLTKYELVFRASARPSREPKGARPRAQASQELERGRSAEEASDAAARAQTEAAAPAPEKRRERGPKPGRSAEEASDAAATTQIEAAAPDPERRRERGPKPERRAEAASDAAATKETETAAPDPEKRQEPALEPERSAEAAADAVATRKTEPAAPAPEKLRERAPEPERRAEEAAELAPAEGETPRTEPEPKPAAADAGATVAESRERPPAAHAPPAERAPSDTPRTEEPAVETAAVETHEVPAPENAPSEPKDETPGEAAKPDEPAPEPPNEEVAHLPSFYRSAVPPKPPAAKPEPTAGSAPERERRPEPPAPPVEEAPLEEGELPVFYRPRPKDSEPE